MALRAVTIGYADPRVNAAAVRQIELGNNLTRPSLVELEAAELLVDLIPSVEMVKFAKNGSNVTTAALKLARAFTGREFVCVPRQQPFFSFDDWFIGTTAMSAGVAEASKAATLAFDYGRIETLEALFDEHPGDVAAVMLEAATTLVPCPGSCPSMLTVHAPCRECPNRSGNFLQQVQALCRSRGALLILDEMITGFRWDLRGAGFYFGIEPDLVTFGKGMANGFSVAAVGGRRDVMTLGSIDTPRAERLFLLSSTHGGEMGSLGAFIEAMAIYDEKDVIGHLWEYGRNLRQGLTEVALSVGVGEVFIIEGPDVCLNYVLRGSDGAPSLPLRTLFAQEMIREGVLMPWISVSLAHDDGALRCTLDAAEKALHVLKRAVDGEIGALLEGPPVKPVFRKFN
jgi:glutamate-1-semialdehyde 2,1-aminomutase